MEKRRRVVVYVATSADGYIAREDGTVEWLDRPQSAGDYGMGAFTRRIDTVLWGRKTYELALGFGERATEGFGTAKNYVFSRHPPAAPAPGFEFVQEPIADFVRRLRDMPGKDIWVMGGAKVIGALVDAGEVDAFVLHVIPTLIGEGIPLLAPRRRLVPLTLRSARSFADGVVRLHYLVERGTPRKRRPDGHGQREPGAPRRRRRSTPAPPAS
jgi:dihydrofolate reductase